MGNTQSRILGSFYYVAYSVSALITLICLFGIPRAQVVLLVKAQTAPTITTSGSVITDMGTSGSFGSLLNAKLDASQTVLIVADTSNGVLMASAAPYAYDKRTTGAGAFMCTFDGTEVSSSSTSKIYCRKNAISDTFRVFKYSDLSAVQGGGGTDDPLYVAAGTNLGSNGWLQVVGTSLFVTSSQSDGKLYRVSLSSFTYTGTVTSTKTIQDSSATSADYAFGACDSGSFCYTLSAGKKLAKFTQDTSGSPTYVSTLDLSVAGQLDAGTSSNNCNDVVLDTVTNTLFAATASGTFIIAKINLATFAFESRVSVTDASLMSLCDNCLTGDGNFMMIISYTSAKDARFIKTSDMTEVTDAGTFVDTSNPGFTGWLTTNGNHGGIVILAEVQALTTTGVDVTATTTTTTTTTSTTTTTTTATPVAVVDDGSSSTAVIVGASVGGSLALLCIVLFIIWWLKFRTPTSVVTTTDTARNGEQTAISTTETSATAVNMPEVSTSAPSASAVSVSVPSVSAISVTAPPPSRCFKRGVPDKILEPALQALLGIREAPPNRPDLDNWIPDKKDASDVLHCLNTSLKGLKDRPAIQKLIAENGLTDDDIKILHCYKIQTPYPVYLWLNGWLGSSRRDDFVKENVAPFFVLLYRAMEKLPRLKTPANRGIKVNGIPALKKTYDNFEKACAPGNSLSFWGFSSFSTKSDVVNREEFVGKPNEEAIVYSCGQVEGVFMEPFAPEGLKDESEILPLCPCVLEVQTAVKMGQKLVVGVKQLDHADYSYVDLK